MANHTEIPPELKKFHDDGACIERHDRDRTKFCHYDKNGYVETLTAARKVHYNHDGSPAPRGFDPAQIVGLQRSWKTRTIKKTGQVIARETTPEQQQGRKANPKIWDVDGCAQAPFPNFKPKTKGAHYPYRHQWHHLIPSASLRDGLHHDEYGEKPILCLLVGKYNLNAGENVVLLPEEGQVGQIIKWPIHPTCHPQYNEYTEDKLSDVRDRLASALAKSKGEVHEVDKETAGQVAGDIRTISKKLYEQLEQWGRTCGAGLEINRIREAPPPPAPPGTGAGRGRYGRR